MAILAYYEQTLNGSKWDNFNFEHKTMTKDLLRFHIKQIMNVFTFMQWK